MRRIFSILIITLLLANGAGFYIYFYFRLVEIKKEMQAEILRTSPELLQRIVLSTQEYNLAKEGDDEIEWNGFMYDIASIKFKDDKVEILALRDEFETKLLSYASGVIQFSSNDLKTPPSALMLYLSLTFTIPGNQATINSGLLLHVKHNTFYLIASSDSIVRIILPPPESKKLS